MAAEPDEPTFDIAFALRKMWPRDRKDREGRDRAIELAAVRVVDHLRLCGWQIRKRPPLAPHRTPAE